MTEKNRTATLLVVGGAGMLGQRLARRLMADGRIGNRQIGRLHLVDVHTPQLPDANGIATAAAVDIARDDLTALVRDVAPDFVFHLAAIVSGEAERNFELGYRVNVAGTTKLLEAIRQSGTAPRFVFASSLAVFGGWLPEVVPDAHRSTPQSSYGTQKAIGELLVRDYSRKGYIDGVSIRLPTIMVRPGLPNGAASSFLSGIVREPLNGQEAILPVDDAMATWVASPDVAVASLIHAATLEREMIGHDRALTGRGITVTVGGIVSALARVAGQRVAARVRRQLDPSIAAIVGTWPRSFACEAAVRLGFPVDRGIDEIIRAYIDTDLGGRFVD